jgi:CheY-like chemotaxis protein/AraC-like DNA-binding protein
MHTDILLIDDSPTDLKLLMDMMETRQLRIAVAFDGDKGYSLAQLLQPSLILLDVRMPKLDGIATCRLLKAHRATQLIPIIFLTAANDLRERLEGFAVGAVDYIGKPFHAEEVLARVGVHLHRAASAEPTPADDAGREAALVRAALTALRETIAHPPGLPDLARLLGTNRRYLNEAFQRRLGQPVFGWLREERLRQAHHLVCRTDTPLSQIAEHLGYSSPANFARAFGERFGFRPSDLRRDVRLARHRGGPDRAH